MNVSALLRLMAFSMLFPWLVACTGEVKGVLGSVSIPDNLGTLSLDPVYASNSNWLDYVKNNNGGSSTFDQPDTACDGSEMGGYSQCIHGGEKRKVTLSGLSSCNNISASDDLDVFQWTCSLVSGTATVFMQGLKSGKGLKDLIDGTGWKNNSVKVYYSAYQIASTTSEVWWTNPIVEAPDNNLASPIALDGVNDGGNDAVFTSGTIFRVSSTTSTSGYNLNLDKLGFVVLDGASLNWDQSATNGCDYATAELVASEKCILAAGSQNFLWIEGSLNGSSSTAADFGIHFFNVKFSRINLVNYQNGDDTGIGLHDSSSNRISHVKISNPGSFSNVYSDNGDYNFFYDVTAANAGNEGLFFFNGSDNNTVVKAKIMNNGLEPLHFSGSTNGTLVDIISANSGNASLHVLNGSHNITVSHFGSYNEDDESLYTNSNNGTYNQYAVINNGNAFGAFYIGSSSNNIFSQLVAANGHDDGIELNSSSNNTFTNNILLGSLAGSNCVVSGGTNPGITSACANQGSSNANIITGIDLSSSLFGKVTSNDSANTSDASGTAAFSNALDWFNFENWFRTWGRDGSAFPNNDNTVDCTSGTCRIWDWRLSSADTQILNRSGNGSSANESFVADSPCPSAVHGNYVLTDQNSSPRTFLVNAVEIVEDYVGNDNGLCESNEACIYSPNYGAYQGEGDYTANGTCSFQDGTVSGVEMYAYPTNGF